MGCGTSKAFSATSGTGNTVALKPVKAGGFSNANFITENHGKLHEFYEVQAGKLGQGSYGAVSKGTNKSTGAMRAVKSISKATVKSVERFRTEIQIMKTLDHPNIIKLYETFEDHRSIYLVMELCSGGELFDRVIEYGHMTERDAAVIMSAIFHGIYYMHSQRIMHRDVKPENFLLVERGLPIDKSTLKIIDFGLSCKFEPGEMVTTKAGTPYYVSPQVLGGRYSEACDLWSCGVIMYILLCGYPPFYGETDSVVLNKVRLGNYTFNAADWKAVSQDAKDLICNLLKMSQDKRFRGEQALKHTWIRDRAPKAGSAALPNSIVENLHKFSGVNKLKKAALHVIATHLDENTIQNLRTIFMQLDADDDGQLTVDELKAGIDKAGVTDMTKDLEALMEALDADGSGQIDYTEFLAATIDKKHYMQEDVCWSAFRVFDRDGDGKISKKELMDVLANGDVENAMGAEAVQELIADCDIDGDGTIDFQEFLGLMRK